MKTLYLDCFCGISGDMTVGALIDAGVDFETLRDSLASLKVDGYALSADKVNKHGIAATQFRVHVDEEHDHPHRHLKEVLEIIEGGDLPDAVKDNAAAVFQRIAECEAEVHGTTPDKIHFHEVGAVDSIIDIVGAELAKHMLGVEQVYASTMVTGYGTVKCAHGILPVPAPATAALLKGVPVQAGDVEAELVTPTGAALVTQWTSEFGAMPAMQPLAIGYGSGMRDLPDRPNVLRALLGETEDVSMPTTSITVVEANVDDMSPELLAPLIAKFIETGARDAFLTPILGKKGRPGYLITVLCDEDKLSAITDVYFEHSSTFGVRIRQEDRICLEREWKTVTIEWGTVKIKIGRHNGQVCRTAPEYEACRALAESAGVSIMTIYEQALAAAVKGEFDHA